MDILNSGINLMIFGMGTVFIFLSILIVTTTLMSWVVNNLFKQDLVVSEVSVQQSSQIDPKLLGILQAAVDAHKNPK